MRRPSPLPGVPTRCGEAAGVRDCGAGRPRQGSQWDGVVAGALGAAAHQEAASQDFSAEGFAAALQRDLSLLAPPSVRTAHVGPQAPALRTQWQDVTRADDGREGAAFKQAGSGRRDDGDDTDSGASQQPQSEFYVQFFMVSSGPFCRPSHVVRVPSGSELPREPVCRAE